MYRKQKMLKFKKILLSLFISIPIIASGFWEGLKTWPKTYSLDRESTPKVDGETVDDINKWPKTFTDKLTWILHFPSKNDYITSLGYVMAMIQVAINWLLGMLGFIALVYMIYCGFLVFSSWTDDKNASKGKKWIWTAAIALAGIGVSWLIISMILWLINYRLPG
jgi:hypothetical protein